VPRFESEALQIPADVRDFVIAKMREHLIELHRQKMAGSGCGASAGSSEDPDSSVSKKIDGAAP